MFFSSWIEALQSILLPYEILTRNTHAQSMPRAEEYPEICKQISVVATCSMLVRGAGDEI